MTQQELNGHIKDIDCGMMTTFTEKTELNSRPMLTITDENNPNNLYFFCMKSSQKIIELQKNNKITISYQDHKAGTSLHIFGTAKLIDNPEEMQAHWDKKLNVWWKDEGKTGGICMIAVTIKKYRFWTTKGSGEVSLLD